VTFNAKLLEVRHVSDESVVSRLIFGAVLFVAKRTERSCDVKLNELVSRCGCALEDVVGKGLQLPYVKYQLNAHEPSISLMVLMMPEAT
jgi:hypothetical protein